MRHTKGSLWIDLPDTLPVHVAADGNLTVRGGKGVVCQTNANSVVINRRGFATSDMMRIDPAKDWVELGVATIFGRDDTDGPQRPNYWDVPGRSSVSEMLAVVCVNWPEFPSEPFLRPPAIGMGVVAGALRERPILLSELVGKLPSVIDLDKLYGLDGKKIVVPPIGFYERMHGDFCGDIYSGWSTDTRTPDNQHPGYGTYLLALTSQIYVVLCSKNYTREQKMPLVAAMCQWGMDLDGAFGDGRDNSYANGGHMVGRKGMCEFFGHMLNDKRLMGLTAKLGRVFAEDHVFQRGEAGNSWWFQGWRATWQHSHAAEFIQRPPSTWSESEKLRFGYIYQVVGAMIGTALAFQLMGRSGHLGWPVYHMCSQWMHGMPKRAADQLAAEGFTTQTGQDYAVGQGAGMCSAAWRQVMQGARSDEA